MGQPDYRIYELNKRLQQRTDVSVSIESRFDLLLFYFCLTYNSFFVLVLHLAQNSLFPCLQLYTGKDNCLWMPHSIVHIRK